MDLRTLFTSAFRRDPRQGLRRRTPPGGPGAALLRHVRRLSPRRVSLLLGWLVLALGCLAWMLPAPGGTLVIAAGASLIMANSATARRQFVRLNRRYPTILGPLRTLLSPRLRAQSRLWARFERAVAMPALALDRLLLGGRLQARLRQRNAAL